MARNDSTTDSLEFILYRGIEKTSKLRFLHHMWLDLHQRSLKDPQLEALKQEASAIAANIPDSNKDYEDLILDGLVARECGP